MARALLVEKINHLPPWARNRIHDLETRADPSGDIQELADLREQRQALFNEVEELSTTQRNSFRAE